jgi:hypothetical protein
MNCPDCHGKGYFIGVAHFDMVDGKSYNKFGKIPCRLCEATGAVPDEMQKWSDIGKRMRADRLKRKEVQRVAASRMGLTLKEYSEIERGAVDNSKYI